MKKMDCVEVLVEKDEYAKYGVHKGMQGEAVYMGYADYRWCISFPHCTDKSREIRLPINTKDLKHLPDGIDPKRNGEIRRKFDEFIEGDGFKMMDCVEVIVEKAEYTQDGVHKGMQGWICLDDCTDGYWLVNFPQCYDKDDIAEISIHENDMIKIPVMHAKINEEIKEKFGD